MRLVDLLGPYLADVEVVVDRSPASLHVGRQLFLPDGIDLDRSASTADTSIGPKALALAVVGPDPDVHGDPDVLIGILDRLAVGGRVATLFGWRPADLPYHRILDGLAAHRCQVLQTADLDDMATPSAVIVERVDRLELRVRHAHRSQQLAGRMDRPL